MSIGKRAGRHLTAGSLKHASAGDVLNVIGLLLLAFATVYPFIYLVSVSISDPALLSRKDVILLPRGLSLETYATVMQDNQLWNGYKNTIIQTALDVTIGITCTMMMAYPLALRGDFTRYSSVIMKMVLVTMYFSGGLIPSFLLVKHLGMIDTVWALVMPGMVSSFHLIIARTFIQQLPADLYDASAIDGANEAQTFFRIVLPLCMPIVAVITLYRAVSAWNAFFTPLLYLNTPSKYPLQIYLRQLITQAQMTEYREMANESLGGIASMSIRACVLVVSTVPILIAYPFLQKYFVKGMMIGAIKG